MLTNRERLIVRNAQHLAGIQEDAQWLREELTLAKRHQVQVITQEDAGYPEWIRTIPDPPLALYIKGSLSEADRIAVGIIGARRASCYGLSCADRLAYELALRGVTIVSGLARGIDGAAHDGALKAEAGRTLAVLGNGLADVYPPEHAALAKRIVCNGALISEYPMRTPPMPYNFPRRNRLISGLALGIVVVEAGSRSGALITADCALEQGREVFAVPGPMTSITSQGTHRLLKQGACLVTSVQDILEELRLVPQVRYATPEAMEPQDADLLPEPAQRVLGCVSRRQPRDIDAIAAQSGLDAPEVSSLLLQLEVQHLIRQLPGKQFIRAIQRP